MSDLRGAVVGDNYQLTVSVTDLEEELIETAWFTLKRNPRWPDSRAVLQMEITTTESADGIVEHPSPIDGTATLTFTKAQIDILPEIVYHYDVQIRTDSGAIYTVESGTFVAARSITDATS